MEEEIKINQPSWLKRLPRRPRGKKSNYQIRQILKGFELRESAKRFRVRVTGTAVPLSIHSKELKQPWEKAKRSGNNANNNNTNRPKVWKDMNIQTQHAQRDGLLNLYHSMHQTNIHFNATKTVNGLSTVVIPDITKNLPYFARSKILRPELGHFKEEDAQQITSDLQRQRLKDNHRRFQQQRKIENAITESMILMNDYNDNNNNSNTNKNNNLLTSSMKRPFTAPIPFQQHHGGTSEIASSIMHMQRRNGKMNSTNNTFNNNY